MTEKCSKILGCRKKEKEEADRNLGAGWQPILQLRAVAGKLPASAAGLSKKQLRVSKEVSRFCLLACQIVEKYVK